MASRQEDDNSREEIMRATYRALCQHGYAELTMQDIADEFDKSKSLLHYHYGTKEELMLAFLDRLIGWLPARLEESGTEDPVDRLAEFLERFVIGPDEERRQGFALALFELRMQAVHNEVFREKLVTHYRQNQAELTNILTAGVETGAFRDLDPDAVGAGIYAALEGARMNQVILGAEHATADVIDGIGEYIGEFILVDPTGVDFDPLESE